MKQDASPPSPSGWPGSTSDSVAPSPATSRSAVTGARPTEQYHRNLHLQNERRNPIRSIKERIAGGRRAFYALPPGKRQEIHETAKRLFAWGKDAGTAAAKELTTREGFVYIITNRAWPHAIKIGRAFDPEARLAGYQTSSPYRDYELQYAVYFEDCYEAERTIHRRLDADRLNGEWFQFPLEDAIDAIDHLREQRPCGHN